MPKLPLNANRSFLEGEISRRPCDLHYHDELEFLPVFAGELTCIVDGVRYSARLGFNGSYSCRIFEEATGATFKEYLNFVRICKAEKLLAKTQDSILEISSAVGISSFSYFNRIFKKYHSCSPTTYRNAQYSSGM